MEKREREPDKKARLMEATETVFSRRGYAQATLDEIIELADTGKGTLYKYFGNKDNLFYTLVSLKHKELMEKMQPFATNTELDIESRLIGIVSVWIRFLWDHTVLWQVLIFELTGTNRGYLAVQDAENGMRLATQWGSLPAEEEREAILRYHRLLWEETKPIVQVYADGIRQNFFRKTGNHIEIPENMFFAVAMIVFSRRGKHMEELLNAEELTRNIVSHQLYGLASTASSGA